jgi:hypothetical protein
MEDDECDPVSWLTAITSATDASRRRSFDHQRVRMLLAELGTLIRSRHRRMLTPRAAGSWTSSRNWMRAHS